MEKAEIIEEFTIAWTEAFNAVRVIRASIRQCATDGPLAMLEVLGNYINEIDAVEEDDAATFEAAKKQIKGVL